MDTDAATTAAIGAWGLTKDFGPTRALDGVDFDVRAGEVHGLVGENGAGKSTLMNILAGVHTPTAGRIELAGKAVRLHHPAQAQRLGVAMVHQELNLIDSLSVADNIFLGREHTMWGGVIRSRRTHERAAELLDRLDCDISTRTPVGRLSIAEKQLVEIAKALAVDASVIILDEPTAVLTRREVRRLFDLIERLQGAGQAVIYISHILPEVLEICDRITVLRDGRKVATLGEAEIENTPTCEQRLASLMVGRAMGDHFPARGGYSEKVSLRVDRLSVGERVRGVTFEVNAGEIFGFAGLIGAGRTELGEALAGLRPATGRATLNGQPLPLGDARASVAAGVAYLSEDRKGRGLLLGRSIVENTTLASLDRHGRVLTKPGSEMTATARRAAQLNLKFANLRDPVATLSGGNQQKVALAKWLETRPEVLILDEPTRGVDIGAKEEIYRLIQKLAAEGRAILMISSEMNELLGTCHRIGVMRGGRLVATLPAEHATEELIMQHAAGVGGREVEAVE